MFLVVLFVSFFGLGFHQTVSQTSTSFSYWKEPPIKSGIGEGNASVLVKENSPIDTNTGIKLQVIGGVGHIDYVFERTSPLRIGGKNKDEIYVASKLDFEQMDRITIKTLAFDKSNPTKTGTATMTVFIGDVNDNEPKFQQQLYEITISPLSDIGMPFVKTHAVDLDGSSPNNKVTYSITGGNLNNSFMIDKSSGDISIAKQLVGYDTNSQYQLVVIGVDGGSDPGPLTGTTTVVVKINDIETFTSWKQPPIESGFGSGTASKKLSENTTLGTTTNIELEALGGQGKITYRLMYDQKTFSIGGPANNSIIVSGPIDFEADPYISILIEAEDSSMKPKKGRANMTIMIEDINDNAPVFKKQQYTVTASEDSLIGSIVAVIDAVDNDGTPPNNDIRYSFSDGNVTEFTIDPKYGTITIAKDLRDESQLAYNIQVQAVDGGVSPGPLTGTTMVTIDIHGRDTTVTSASESTTKVTTATTTIVAGATILTPCLFTIFLQGTLLTVY